MICKTEDCEELAYDLSAHTELAPYREKKGVKYHKRTTNYKCRNGHITKVESDIPSDDLVYKPEKDRNTSVKRFHRKGFAGHIVNPPAQPQWYFPPKMTNREKNEWRRERRQRMREQQRVQAS